MKIDFTSNINELTSSCEIHFLYKSGDDFHLTESAKQVDEKTNGLITKTITKTSRT